MISLDGHCNSHDIPAAYDHSVVFLWSKDGSPMIRTPCGGIYTGELGHARSRASKRKQDNENAIYNRHAATRFQADG